MQRPANSIDLRQRCHTGRSGLNADRPETFFWQLLANEFRGQQIQRVVCINRQATQPAAELV